MDDCRPDTPRPRHVSQIKKPLPPAPTLREIRYAISVGMHKVHSQHLALLSSSFKGPHQADTRPHSICKERSYQSECERFRRNESSTNSRHMAIATNRVISSLSDIGNFDPAFTESCNFNTSKESIIRPAERS